MITALHQPVMLESAITALHVQPGKWYLDGTFGRGGHTREILKLGGNVIAFDWDIEAIQYGQATFAEEVANNKLVLIHSSFEYLKQELAQTPFKDQKFAGILFDFGTSTDQLKSSERGFSFEGAGELDMRMDTRLGVKAKDLLAVLSEKQLTQLFQEFGGEQKSHAIARAIVQFREKQGRGPATTSELVDLILRFYPKRTSHLHPATKVFQALRIAVNSELDAITLALPQAYDLLESQGVVTTIAFHEGEDRVAKHVFRTWAEEGKGEILTKKPTTATEEEIEKNPNSRSAKLRIFIKK